MFDRIRLIAQRSSDSARLSARDEKRALKLLTAFEDHTSGWFWETDANGGIVYLSHGIALAFEAAGVNPKGMRLSEAFLVDEAAEATSRSLSFHLTAHKAFTDYAVRACCLSDGEWWSISGRPIVGKDGRFQGFVGSGADLTAARQTQTAIARLAYTDSLTGLANRQRMHSSMADYLSHRTSGFNPTALLLIDLDRFKTVNDTLGHQVGDELLKQVALRLQRVVEKAGLIARIGGDEFEVALTSDTSRGDAPVVAKNIISCLSQPYLVCHHPITIGCSVGIAIAPEHGQDVETLSRNADLALYSAKDAGRGLYRTYTSDLLAGAQRRKQLEDDLRNAIEKGQMYLVYQQVVSTQTGSIVGYEALIRWNHPLQGLISPAEFIPVAEDCGIIEALGEWVLRTAVTEAARLPSDIRIAVNVSSIQFSNPAFVSVVTSALASSGLDPKRLELEITESVFLNDSSHSDKMFHMLKAIGVRLALDDFGTGYSSLGYLRNAPFDKIKIDQSFVRGAIQDSQRNAAIISAIVTLANAMGMETTAEGVEQQDEIDFIRSLGCTSIQGFVYGKPIEIDGVREHLKRTGSDSVPLGPKISRALRRRVFRSAKMIIGKLKHDVFVRDLSSYGAMIETAKLTEESIGIDVLLELVEGQIWTGNVRWVRNGRAGLKLKRSVGPEVLA